jgi:hypothetical protein
MTRILLPLIVLASFGAAQPSGVRQPDFHLRVVPAVVYKVDDKETPERHHSSSILR